MGFFISTMSSAGGRPYLHETDMKKPMQKSLERLYSFYNAIFYMYFTDINI